jgi:hypothetical protein
MVRGSERARVTLLISVQLGFELDCLAVGHIIVLCVLYY